ncbi:MAG: hypothetical protein D6732_02755 [Methanobacteriota archaeon]|nr:MAG: hypothetical protein D6732_02755 [Euryarchaeota archaeon]
MNRKKRIEQEVQKTLEQFQQADRLPPDPYFYTRLKSRLAEKQRKGEKLPVLLKPAFLTLLFLLNIITAGWYWSAVNTSTQTNARQELVTMMASEFRAQPENIELFNVK